MIHEGALIAFTLLIHLAVGASLLYALKAFTSRDMVLSLPSGFNIRTPELILFIIVLLALAASFFHLGKPVHATNALNNLSSSWISREILGVSLFAGSMLLLFIGRLLYKDNRKLLMGLFFLLILSGVFLIGAMTRLYMIPTVVTWRAGLTPASFGLQTLTLGLCGLLIYILLNQRNLFHIKPIIFWLAIALIFEMIVAGLFQGFLQQISVPHVNQLISEGILLRLTIFRIIIITSALIFLLYLRTKIKASVAQPLLLALLILTLVIIIFEQGLGKYIFYASYVRIGI
ncbi:MAG TPA: DmsC/YnfH family molybdoenzyme membrane anchor subunit [Bacteroidales bacterium]|nr:DmsC/YnfH family molybdoenzyme membrane anchor subunit [Bacteroidales bacterium]